MKHGPLHRPDPLEGGSTALEFAVKSDVVKQTLKLECWAAPCQFPDNKRKSEYWTRSLAETRNAAAIQIAC